MGRFPVLSAVLAGGLLALLRLATGFLPVFVQVSWLPVAVDAALFGVIGFVTARRAAPAASAVSRRLGALVAPAVALVAVFGIGAGPRVLAWSARGAWLGSLVAIPAAAAAGARVATRLAARRSGGSGGSGESGESGQAGAAVSRGAT